MRRLTRRRRVAALLGAIGLLVFVTTRAGGSTGDDPLPGPRDEAGARRAGAAAGPAPAPQPTTRSLQAAGPPPAPSNSPQVPWATARVYATQYAPNTSGSVEVAVPDKCVKFAALRDQATLNNFKCGSGYPIGLDYRVLITRDNGQSAYFPVKEVGPWNIDDNYWDPADSSYPRSRRLFGDLARGLPESQAAFYNGYHTVANCGDLNRQPTDKTAGADQFNRCVLNPSGVDLSLPAAAQLGITGSEWVTASFAWEPLDGLLAFPYSFRGGSFVTSGDTNLDGTSEVISGADAGGGPHVTVYDPNGVARGGFFAYPSGFRGGVRVASGNVLGGNNIVTAPGPGGGPDIEIYRGDAKRLGGFYAYAPGVTSGVYVATGNVDGASGDEIITGAGRGGGPHVRAFKPDGTALGGGFYAYAPNFTGGVRVAVGDVNGDGVNEIITAPGPGGGPDVEIYRADGTRLGGFYAYSPGFTAGVYVGVVRSPDGSRDWIVTGAGEGGGPHVRVFDGSGNVKSSFMLTNDGTAYGVRPAGGHFGSAPGDLVVAQGPGAVPLERFRHLNGAIFYP